MNFQFLRRSRVALKWIAGLMLMNGWVTGMLAQGAQSFYVASPVRNGSSDGMSYQYSSNITRITAFGAAGRFSGDALDWRIAGNADSNPPGNIRELDNGARETHLAGGGLYSYNWADNFRTVVIVGIDLSRLPGMSGTDAKIEVMGAATGSSVDALDFKGRVETALARAVGRLPSILHHSGVRDAVWERLKKTNDPDGYYGGVLIEVLYAYDIHQKYQAVAEAKKILADRVEAFRRAKNAPVAIGTMARLHSLARESDAWAEARREAETNDLPAGWTFRAWEAMDRNDYGAATIGFVTRAEQALKRVQQNLDRSVGFAVIHAGLPGYGPSMTQNGSEELWAAYRYNAAYVGYTRGILEENLASRAAGEAAKKKHTDAAREAFRLWRQNDYGDDDEEGLWRNTQDDVKLGWDDPFLLRARAIAQHDGRRGFGVNRREALAAFQRAEALGSIDSKNWIGLMMDRSSGVTNDPVAAVKKFQEAANLGNRYAKANLARSLAFGVGIPRDMTRAKSLYKEAAQPHKTWDKFFDGTLGTHWLETSSSGDVMEVTLMHDAYPVSLKTLGEQQGIEGRSLKFKVSYTLSSIASVRIRPVVDRSISNYSPAPVLQDEGEHVLWIASAQTTLRETDLLIEMVDAATDKVILKLQVPVLARWDR